jgi:hypothetical protein
MLSAMEEKLLFSLSSSLLMRLVA